MLPFAATDALERALNVRDEDRTGKKTQAIEARVIPPQWPVSISQNLLELIRIR